MSGETVMTIIGHVVKEVDLRFTPAGAAVAKFTVASTPRTYNKQAQAWEDGSTLFLPVTVWRQQAENVASSVEKGTRVIVQGRLSQRSYEDREGNKRTVYEVEAEDVAVSLRNATAAVSKASGGGGRGDYEKARQAQGQASAQDPWTSPPGTQPPAAGGWGGGDEAPF